MPVLLSTLYANDIGECSYRYCFLRPSYGSCKGLVRKWFYDPRIQNCKMFFYSGCGGNDNRFSKEGWCQWYCLPRNKMRKSVCSRRPYGEKCYGRTERWYFDKYANTCRQFKNGYCGLVPNRFETCWQCINRCSDADPNSACPESIGVKKV
ncbi:hypothetical protein MTO96_038224 [Rhipicephalus appendiculatus]